jgi:hypothetical protein
VYLELLTALEQSWLGHTARHSAWLFTIDNVLHVLGAALVVGAIAVFDIKLIRDPAGAPDVGRVALPLAALGLAIQIPTGIVLLAVEARALGTNPAFYVKMAFIALGIANLAFFHLKYGWVGGRSLPESARAHGAVSLVAWVMVLLAGRMIAYI